jgi:hypothetical protein
VIIEHHSRVRRVNRQRTIPLFKDDFSEKRGDA